MPGEQSGPLGAPGPQGFDQQAPPPGYDPYGAQGGPPPGGVLGGQPPDQQYSPLGQPNGGQGPGFDQGQGPGFDQGYPGAGGPSSAMSIASTTAVSDSTIRISVDGEDYTFLPGTEITIGRDPSCLVPIDERHSLVSRRHLKVSFRDNAWWIDDYSSKGTFVDGRRISADYRAEGAFMVQLGDEAAGTPMRVITSGEHNAPARQNLVLFIVIGILALIAIGALVIALTSDSGGGGEVETDQTTPSVPGAEGEGEGALGATAPVANSADPAQSLAAAKQSTVLLLADNGLGSGFFVTDKLIVTNQHVAQLDETLTVAVSRVPDDPAMAEYNAQMVASHPFLDIAVLALTTDLAGSPVDGAGLIPVTIGASAQVTLGDEVFNTGFAEPLSDISLDDMGAVRLPPVSVSSGQAANFSIWPGCSNPDREGFIPIGAPATVACAPDGDIQRGVVITTFASGRGASGSPVFRGNEVIAVVFAGQADEANAGRNITTDSFSGWLDTVITDNA